MKNKKLIIFDLDGVLIDSREIHYQSLNEALMATVGEKYVISWNEHLAEYDGLPTSTKLKMLAEKKGLDPKRFEEIKEKKQEATINALWDIQEKIELQKLFFSLKENGFKIGVASNAVRDTVKMALLAIGIMRYVDVYVSNEDVKHNKPYPEMYWKIMVDLKILPQDTIIIEDSHVGREGAIASGAHLLPVEGTHEVTKDYILKGIDEILGGVKRKSIPWRNKKMNVLIPMAGQGSRFAAAGYTFPKPLIEVNGKPMIQVVVDNLNVESHFVFIVLKEHYKKYNLQYLLSLIAPGCDIVQVDTVTEGAACTTLLAKKYIDNDDPLLIANSDQFVEWNSNEVLYAFSADAIDAGIVTFEATHPKWSYAKIGENGFVSEVAEKKVISNEATVGIYYWKKGSDYVKYAERMIAKNDRTNGEFYVCPAFNHAIADGKKVRVKRIDKMWGIGTPEDLNYFLQNYKG